MKDQEDNHYCKRSLSHIEFDIEQPSLIKWFYSAFCPCLIKKRPHILKQQLSPDILQVQMPNTDINRVKTTKNKQIQINNYRESLNFNDQILSSSKPKPKKPKSKKLERFISLDSNPKINKKQTLRSSESSLNQTHIIYRYPENQLIPLGKQGSRLLAFIKSVIIQPSLSSIQKTQNSQDHHKKTQLSANYLDKFWDKRYYLFEKFDEGIRLDEGSWYSCIPEAVAYHIASKVRCQTILDGFSGVGSCSIKFANTCNKVIANDLCQGKIDCLITNTKIYGAQNVEIYQQDFLKLDKLEPQVVFIAPPWCDRDSYERLSVKRQKFEISLQQIIVKAVSFSTNIVMLLPPNICVQTVISYLCDSLNKNYLSTCCVKIQKIIFMGKLKYIIFYFGVLTQNQIKLNSQLQFVYDFLADGQNPYRHKRVIREIRQTHGMIKLLNILFECVKLQYLQTNEAKFQQYLKISNLIDQNKLQKLIEYDQLETERTRKKKLSGTEIMEQQKYIQNQSKSERTNSQYSNYDFPPMQVYEKQDVRSPRRHSSSFHNIQIQNVRRSTVYKNTENKELN